MSNTQQSNTASSTGRLDAFTVVKKPGRRGQPEKTYWHRIGVAFPHEDGQGFNVRLVAHPVDGELVLRVPLPKRENEMSTASGAAASDSDDDDIPF